MDDWLEVYLEETSRGDEQLILQQIFDPLDYFHERVWETTRISTQQWVAIPGGYWRRQLPGDA